MANVLIDETILQGWAETVRRKTGTSDKMKPSVLLEQTETNWGSGGGGSNLVRYVTFLAEDGSELFKMPVLVGDTCKDPVSHGDISKPVKEPTNTIAYTHNGWSATAGGDADSNILKNITEDKTVHVAFKAETRYYTIVFYDGATVIKTVEATYGANLSEYILENKEGYVFAGWNPSVSFIASEFSTYAVWEEDQMDEWDYLYNSIADGTYTQYTVGQKFPITLKDCDNNNVSVNMVLAAINHDEDADGNKATFTFISEKTIAVGNPPTSGYSSGWSGYSARSFCNGSLKNSLPDNVQGYIKPVLKKYQKDDAKQIYTVTDSVWIPSATELGAKNISYVADGQGEPYSGLFTDNASRTKKTAIGSSSTNWQTRTMNNSTTNPNSSMSSLVAIGLSGEIKIVNPTSSSASGWKTSLIGFCI